MYKTYFAIEKKIKAQGFNFERRDIIQQFTNGKKSGLSQLTHFEYAEFIRWLNRTYPSEQKSTTDDQCQLMRRKIIALFRKMGYTNNDKADMQRIEEWCVKYGKFKKKLNAHPYEELTALVTQVESVYKSYILGL